MPPTIWYEGRVTRIDPLNSNTRSFWIEVPETDRFDFQAGQFITMDLPIHEKRVQRWRSYSIASAPDGTNAFELCIVQLEGGLATQYLFEEVRVGSVIRFKGPGGAFVLPETLDRDLVMVCTGTGVAPFRSMLWDIHNKGIPHRKLHLIFGTRFEEGILYKTDFIDLMNSLPGFTYSVALSRENPEETCKEIPDMRRGYVHPIYLEAYPDQRPDVLFYLCGWSAMVDEAVVHLTEDLGYPPSQIRTELYG